ncbi:prephenate dehydratase [Allorhodopirellula heiligendammensis]|uniref:prephenate dehydratase n=1 Tax=Allorhodopirellula heiligendammensis TaxID=2714739 RepID=A0A5C6BY85_9BACT|nr:prephenate dehydratase [Allorhodopirellula heiligendammensis]TWU16226.1 P-protein [Allorhodopirellula heiligendammensis]
MSDSTSLPQIDQEILALIDRRQQLVATQLGGEDRSGGLPAALADAEKVAEKISLTAQTGVSVNARRSILRHIVSACYQASKPELVAFLGPVDSYSHLAALEYFGGGTDLSPVSSIGAVFDAVSRGDCGHGIVPIENSTDGRIVDTLGRLAQGHVNITGELLLAIHHNLLSLSPREEIRQVHSKPQALSQCRGWLADHLPGVELVETASTAAAAEAAAATPGIAAVASLAAATRYGLGVVQASIEDNRHNVTRFAVLGSGAPEPTGDDKTTLLFEVQHRPGALADVMGIVRDHGLNLTWIESFPQPGRPNEYFFIVEFPGHQAERAVAGVIATLRQQTQHLAVLGSYPQGRKV